MVQWSVMAICAIGATRRLHRSAVVGHASCGPDATALRSAASLTPRLCARPAQDAAESSRRRQRIPASRIIGLPDAKRAWSHATTPVSSGGRTSGDLELDSPVPLPHAFTGSLYSGGLLPAALTGETLRVDPETDQEALHRRCPSLTEALVVVGGAA